MPNPDYKPDTNIVDPDQEWQWQALEGALLATAPRADKKPADVAGITREQTVRVLQPIDKGTSRR